MSRPSDPLSPPPSRTALLRYVAGWLLTGAAAAALIIVLIHQDDDARVPPVRQTELGIAARAGGCELRAGTRTVRGLPRVDGPAAPPARPAVYRNALAEPALVGAMRRGVVVIHYRPGLAERRISELEELQEDMPVGTILAPNGGMRFAIAVTSYRRRLACRAVRPATLDAVQLFRGRYVGSGPDR